MQRLHPNPLIHYSLLIIIFGAGAVSLLSMTVAHAFSTHQVESSTSSCEKALATHKVTLKNRHFDTETITADRCDRLIIVNEDSKIYQLAVGSHDNHTVYPGFRENVLKPAGKISVVLTKIGEYKIHDHLHEASDVELIIR